MEATGSTPTEYRAYVPSDPEVRALLSRDRAHLDDPYKAAIVDTLIITMKGVAAGMLRSLVQPYRVEPTTLIQTSYIPMLRPIYGVR